MKILGVKCSGDSRNIWANILLFMQQLLFTATRKQAINYLPACNQSQPTLPQTTNRLQMKHRILQLPKSCPLHDIHWYGLHKIGETPAPNHTSKLFKNYLKVVLTLMDFPPPPPNLNPIHGGTWGARKPSILWHRRKLCETLSNHAGITWVIRLRTNVWSPCQLECMLPFKQNYHILRQRGRTVHSAMM